MREEIAFENGRISTFQGLVTLTLDRVILHTIMHRSSTSTYMPNFIEIEETFCGRTGGRTFETHCIRSTQRSRPNNSSHLLYVYSSWRLLVMKNVLHNAVICIRSSTAKRLGVCSQIWTWVVSTLGLGLGPIFFCNGLGWVELKIDVFYS